ncbi:MAG TPA: hypothetical protein VK206_21745 [Anaerolineales bacterium]|nr:hypothetical protein [Anaerolineales bacterium]
MNKIRASLSQLLLLLFLVGCLPPTQQSIEHPSSTPVLENSILISYEHDGNDSIDRFTGCLIGLNTLSFVLYDNGRVVLFDGSQFMESTIPQSEVEKLLANIESTGFFSVKGNGDEFVSPPPTPSFVGDSQQIITVKKKTFAITTGQYQYLAEPIKDTIEIVSQYQPQRLAPYVPDKLYLWVYPIQDTALTNYNPTPTPPTLEWAYESIPLDTLVFEPYGVEKTISGKYLQFFMQEVKTVPVYRMVKQNGQHYLVMACPAFQ